MVVSPVKVSLADTLDTTDLRIVYTVTAASNNSQFSWYNYVTENVTAITLHAPASMTENAPVIDTYCSSRTNW